jgi:hypothetical protein
LLAPIQSNGHGIAYDCGGRGDMNSGGIHVCSSEYSANARGPRFRTRRLCGRFDGTTKHNGEARNHHTCS